MADQTSNDNASSAEGLAAPAAHGEAALLLVESLIHGLVARDVLTVGDAVEIVEIAAEVNSQIAVDLPEVPAASRGSIALLEAISTSLRHDLPSE